MAAPPAPSQRTIALVARDSREPVGGDLQIGAITTGEVDAPMPLWDPLQAQPHDQPQRPGPDIHRGRLAG